MKETQDYADVVESDQNLYKTTETAQPPPSKKRKENPDEESQRDSILKDLNQKLIINPFKQL